MFCSGAVAAESSSGLLRAALGASSAEARLEAARRHPAFDFGAVPVYFEKDPHGARFQARTSRAGLLFERDGFWMQSAPNGDAVEVHFEGARSGADPAGEHALSSSSYYFEGNGGPPVPRPHFASVRYNTLWPGIDARFYAQDHELEYDFNVAPHADPAAIWLDVEAADALTIDPQGNLWIPARSGRIRQRPPLIYQQIGGHRVPVSGGYRLIGRNGVGFRVGAYDPAFPLVIDPVLEFSTYLGGAGFDVATTIAVDASNNIYVAGYTQFADFLSSATRKFPATLPSGNTVFLVKLDGATRQVVFADFLGGSYFDAPWSIKVDSSGSITMVGQTSSANFPTNAAILANPAGFQYNPPFIYGFATRFTADGTGLVYSTYTAPGGPAYGLGLDSNGGAWIGGVTICFTDYPDAVAHEFSPTPDAQKRTCTNDQPKFGYLMHLNSAGSQVYATYYGSTGTAFIEDLTVDTQGNVYAASLQEGSNVVNRVVQDANGNYVDDQEYNVVCSVTKFNSGGHSTWSTTIGGSRDQECLRIAVDSTANVYTTGYTTSSDFPTTAGAFQKAIGSTSEVPNPEHNPLGDLNGRPLFDAFVAKWDTNGNKIYSTYLGGNGDDYAFGVAINSSGIAFVTGYTNSRNFPVTPGALQTGYGGGASDAFVTGISSDGKQLSISTFFGGGGQDEGYQVAIDKTGSIYVAGGTESGDLPLTSDAVQRSVRASDAFVAKFNFTPCNPSVTLSNAALSAAAGTANLTVTTDVAGCAWTLASTSTWLKFTPAAGNGNATVTVNVAANTSAQSRVGVILANSRRTFVYQSGQTACQFLFLPTAMGLSSSSERHLLLIQSSDPTCTWTASSNQSWLHILSPPSGTGSGTITVGTDPNTGSSMRTANLSVGTQNLPVTQAAGGCGISLSTTSAGFGPAGGLGGVNVLAAASTCSWSPQTAASSWILLPNTNTSYGNGLVRFSVTPNNTGQARTGTLTVAGQSVTITQASTYTTIRDQATGSGTSTAGLAPTVAAPMVSGRLRTPQPRSVPGCGSKPPSTPIHLDAAGDPVTVTITQVKSGCNVTAVPQNNWLTVTASGTTVRISANPGTVQTRKGMLIINPNDPDVINGWQWEVDQDGAAPLVIPSSKELQATAGSDVIPVDSSSGSNCYWTVDSASVPGWVKPVSTSGACGTHLEFSYDGNITSSVRRGVLKFTSGDQIELDQAASAAVPTCTYAFQQTSPQSIGVAGGTVTFTVNGSSGCSWTASTDSSGWITFAQGGTGTGTGTLTVQVSANDTTSQRTAQIYIDAATAYITQDPAASFPTGCLYTLSPASNSFTNTGGSFTFQVQTSASCTWQPSQPAADAGFVHLQSTAQVTGPGSVSFTVDANPAGSPARTSTITVAPGVSFAISQAAGASACSYTLSPASTTFPNAGGSFGFQVQTAATCSWQPSQPASDASFVHLQSTTQVTGPGSVSFTVDANPAGAPARASSITVGGAAFTFTEAAGPAGGAAPAFTAASIVNAGSFAGGAVAPGEIVTFYGTNIGPPNLVTPTGAVFPTTLGGTQVTFDGTPAPLIYTAASTLTAIVPYEIAGQTTTQVVVSYNGVKSAPVAVPLTTTAPGLFTSAATGTGQGAILKSDYTVNSASNPAGPGDVILLFGTGEGQTSPAGVDGLIANSVYPKPLGPVTVTIGGIDANVLYSGAAPGLVAGVLQINAVVPAGLQGTQAVVVTIGGKSSAAGVTVALKGTAPMPSGTLAINPNPLNVCSPTASASAVLTWSAINVTSVKIFLGSLSGAVIASGGPNGAAAITTTPNSVYLLADTSGAGTPTSANILATVTSAQGTCPTQNGVAPPTTDLAQSVSNWVIQYQANGGAATGGAADDTSPTDILDGTSCMYIYSTTANTITLTRNAPASGWDFSKISAIQLSMQSDLLPGSWVATPTFRLLSTGGSLTLTPVSASPADPSYFGWTGITAPLAGNAAWTVATSGQFNVQNVTAIQITLNSGSIGWAVLLNGMFLK
jgi:uncharacterized protein (TIGR03437 family)